LVIRLRILYQVLMFFGILQFNSCNSDNQKQINPVTKVLASENPKIKNIIDNLTEHKVQLRYTQISRNNEDVSFKDYSFQVDSSTYFYPASTVKFPIAVLTLAKLNTYEKFNRNTKFYIEGDTLETTFAKEIEKIFAVSDNQSYNRLFEFLGQDYINQQLYKLSIGPSRISHRLSTIEADEITTRPLIVYENDSTTRTLDPSINTSAIPLKLNEIEKGKGFFADDKLINEAFDFSLKNYYPIQTQHNFLKAIVFPEKSDLLAQLRLTKDQLEFIKTAMSQLPKNVGYDSNEFYDGYCKFFLYGDTKTEMPENIKIYNKVGNAYGTLTDCAYVHDAKNNIEFLLTATVLVNNNGIYNDDTYEYEELGIPFLAELGRAFYNFELGRKK